MIGGYTESNQEEIEPACSVEIRFFGPIISILKRTKDEVVLKGTLKVTDVIRILCSRYGERFREIAIHDGKINSGLVIFVNGEQVLDYSMELEPGDRVQMSIASQMPGG